MNFIYYYIICFSHDAKHFFYSTFSIFEALLVAVMTTMVAFLASLWLGTCRPETADVGLHV